MSENEKSKLTEAAAIEHAEKCVKNRELAAPTGSGRCSDLDAIVAYHLIEKARDLLNPRSAIALPTEYECVVCGDRTTRAPKATNLEWIKSVADWCAEHRRRHSQNE